MTTDSGAALMGGLFRAVSIRGQGGDVARERLSAVRPRESGDPVLFFKTGFPLARERAECVARGTLYLLFVMPGHASGETGLTLKRVPFLTHKLP
jgi:hypothetical protein